MKYIYLIAFILFFSTCTNKKNNKPEFKQIHFQFYPAFVSNSMITFTANDSIVTFQRIGAKEIVFYNQFPDSIVRVVPPSSFSFKLSDSLYKYLTKDIHLKKEDLTDNIDANVKDGVDTNILFVRECGQIVDIELRNAYTNTQKQLILKLLDEAEIHAPNSLTLRYLNNLKRHY